MTANEVLKQYFGYDSFRAGQENIIHAIMEGRDTLAIMPTGAGKSICYQVPALMLPGITIVISPLISLMQDQVKALNAAGIHAAFVNSSLTESQIVKVLDHAAEGVYKIIYVAPERLESWDFLQFAEKAEISMVTIDEAHCISQWGQDFRPSYLKIVDFVDKLAKRPILSAFTATATTEVKDDIACILKLQDPNVVITGFDRTNLYYQVESTKNKDAFVLTYIEKHAEESGIIYCATRKNVDTLHEKLANKGLPVTKYHAGIDNETRKKNQDDFIYDRAPIIIATNAFGMGIDKSNVRYVIHYNMPQSMENYYQEAGRAGRDGETSQCILLFSAQDVMINKFLLEKKDFSEVPPEDVELIQQRDVKRLQVMEGYCRTTTCLRNYILGYFGEKTSGACENCGNCHRDYHEVDMTEAAKWLINCVAETKGRYGQVVVLGTVLGANRARLRELGTVNYKSYGKLSHYTEAELRLLLNQLILDGYLRQTEDQYSVIQMGDISPLKQQGAKVMLKTFETKEKVTEKPKAQMKKSTDQLTKAGYELFEILRGLRLQLAREEGLPPYIIFSDKTLIDMCVKVPQNEPEMLNVSGVGVAKFRKYGQRFLDAIAEYRTSHPGVVISMQIEEAGAAEEPVEKPAKKKRVKEEFYLKGEDAKKFVFRELYYISEIAEELNRITTAENVKKVTNAKIWEYLCRAGWVKAHEVDGIMVKVRTDAGSEMGIRSIEKINGAGEKYTLLKYPVAVQKEIIGYFVGFGKNLY